MSRTNLNLQKRLEMLESEFAALRSGEGAHSPPDSVLACAYGPNVRPGSLSGANDLATEDRWNKHGDGASKSIVLGMVEALIASRRRRLGFFDAELFFDPAWSMLLDLFRAELQQKSISVSSLCYGSGVPETTALRYVKILEDRGYIVRVKDPTDRRRVFLCLTSVASDRLTGYFEKVGSEFTFLERRAANAVVGSSEVLRRSNSRLDPPPNPA